MSSGTEAESVLSNLSVEESLTHRSLVLCPQSQWCREIMVSQSMFPSSHEVALQHTHILHPPPDVLLKHRLMAPAMLGESTGLIS